MDIIADTLLAAAALGAAFYCFVLGRRLNKFNSLEKGVGGAVAVLSSQVEDLKRSLDAAQSTASASAETLTDLSVRAEDVSKRLELQIAALNQLPDASIAGSNGASTEAQNLSGEPMFIRHAAGDR